jgi:hypothetical protein
VTDNNGFILALLSIAMGLFARSTSVRHGVVGRCTTGIPAGIPPVSIVGSQQANVVRKYIYACELFF